MAIAKIPKSELKKYGVKLLTKKELMEVDPGDFVDCDTLHQSLLHAGYNARYENVYSDMSGFIAKFYLNNEYVGSVEGSDIGHMVRDWRGLKEHKSCQRGYKRVGDRCVKTGRR